MTLGRETQILFANGMIAAPAPGSHKMNGTTVEMTTASVTILLDAADKTGSRFG